MELKHINTANNNKSKNDLVKLNFSNGITLTAREVEILKLIAIGYENKEIAKVLYVSIHTVKAHIERIFRTLNAKNRANCVYIAKNMHIL